MSLEPPLRRRGDQVAISGDYQARALVSERKAQRFWHAAKFRLIDRLVRPGLTDRVLDAGCGSGTISDHLAKTAASVTAIDSNQAAIDFARASYPRPNLKFIHGQFEEARARAPFDKIYSIEVLEHLYFDQAVEVLTLFYDVARPGTQLFLTTPNYRSAWPLIERALDFFQLVPKLDHDQHVTHFTKLRLLEACSAAGWSIRQLGGFNGLSPFVAPISENCALGLERFEYRLNHFLPLNILFCLCAK